MAAEPMFAIMEKLNILCAGSLVFLNGHSVCYHKLCFRYDITFYFNFILTKFIQGCPVQRGWFEWGPETKTDKKNWNN